MKEIIQKILADPSPSRDAVEALARYASTMDELQTRALKAECTWEQILVVMTTAHCVLEDELKKVERELT